MKKISEPARAPWKPRLGLGTRTISVMPDELSEDDAEIQAIVDKIRERIEEEDTSYESV